MDACLLYLIESSQPNSESISKFNKLYSNPKVN